MNGQHMNATVNILEAQNTGLGASEILRELVMYMYVAIVVEAAPSRHVRLTWIKTRVDVDVFGGKGAPADAGDREQSWN